jgi:hypothetical protein
MFEIGKHKSLVNDLPVITSNYLELLTDEIPILYTGTNKYGNLILGSIIEEDDDNSILWYYQIIITSTIYYDFLDKKNTLLDLFKSSNLIYIITKDYSKKVLDYNLVSLDEIPEDYLPLSNSYCPEIAIPFSFHYGISLKGKKSDEHKAEVSDVNAVQESVHKVLKQALNSLEELNLRHTLYVEPAMTGSFRINFNIEFEELQQTNLFPINRKDISNYLSQYLDFIVSKLPSEEEDIFKKDNVDSTSFKEIENKLIHIYNQASIKTVPVVIENKLIHNINETAHEFEQLSEQIKASKSFTQVDWFNYTNGGEIGIGSINESFYENIKSKLVVEEIETAVSVIEEDKEDQKYRILVYSLNTESGKGLALLFHGDTEKADRISLHITKGDKKIENTVYSNSLHEGKVVDVIGKAKKVDDKYKLLKVTL